MKAYLGFIPFGIAAVPAGIAVVYHEFFSKGCMDGIGFVLFAMLAFSLSGLLNVIYLVFVALNRNTYFSFPDRKQSIIAKIGLTISLILLAVKAVSFLSIMVKNS